MPDEGDIHANPISSNRQFRLSLYAKIFHCMDKLQKTFLVQQLYMLAKINMSCKTSAAMVISCLKAFPHDSVT